MNERVANVLASKQTGIEVVNWMAKRKGMGTGKHRDKLAVSLEGREKGMNDLCNVDIAAKSHKSSYIQNAHPDNWGAHQHYTK